MTNKIQALLSAILAGVTGYIAYFVALPPSLQTGMMGDAIALAPLDWQPLLAGSAKTISTILGFYATYKAAQSGPATKPTNPTNPPKE